MTGAEITTALLTALFNGLSISSILILAALGLGITFGVMRVINMAHGEMMMLGAYTGYLVSDPTALPKLFRNLASLLNTLLNLLFRPSSSFEIKLWPEAFNSETQLVEPVAGLQLNLFWAIPIAFLVVGAMGYLLEVCLIRFLYGRPLDTLLATWGVGLVLQQAVRSLMGADLHALSLPSGLQGRWEVGEVPLTHFRIFIIGFTCLCLFGVYGWFYKTPFGLQIRAVTQNRSMASALGISTRRVDSLTFAFGTGLGGVAGCILAHLYNFHPQMGSDYIVDAFMVVILGGMGHLAGTAVAGVAVGTGQTVLAILLRNAPLLLSNLGFSELPTMVPLLARSAEMMAKVFILVLVVGLILYRPGGLFSRKERYDE